MKSVKFSAILVLVCMLAGCGHEFEGKYRVEMDSGNGLPRATMGFDQSVFREKVKNPVVIIGSDYIESDGERQEMNRIFVRESDGQRYLVMASNSEEEAWKIMDNRTLMVQDGMITMKMVRVN